MLVGALGIPGAHYWCSPTHQPTFGGTPRQRSPKKREIPPMAEGPHPAISSKEKGALVGSTGSSLGNRNQLSGSILGSSTGLRGDSVSVCGQQSTTTAVRTHLLCPPPLHPATPRQGPRSGAPKPHLHPPHLKPLQLGKGQSSGVLAHWLPGRGCKRSSPTPFRPPSWWPCWSHAETCSCTCPLVGPQLPGHGAQELECSPQ